MSWLLPLLVALTVVVIYLLRTPPRPIIVPSSYLWQKLAEKARPLRERLRWLASLLLAMAVACSMAWALIKSPLLGGGRGETALAIVIDNSATMAARRSDGFTRLEEALRVARRAILNNRGPIVVADTAGQIASLAYTDAERARDLLSGIEVDFSEGHRYPPLPDPPTRGSTRTLYLTDGVRGIEPAAADGASGELFVHSVFEAAPNVGITAFDTRRAPDGKLYLYIELVHASDQGHEVRLMVEEATATRLDRVLSLDANELWSGVIDVTGWTSPLSASVELTDAADSFSADDRAWKLIAAEEPARILLLSDRPEGLVALLRSTAPGVVVQSLSTTQLYSQQSAPGFWDDFDVLVADRTAPPEHPPIPTWWLAPPNADYLPRISGPTPVATVAEATGARTPTIPADELRSATTADVTELDLTNYGLETLSIERMQNLDLSSLASDGRHEARILATAGGRPLIIAWKDRTANILQTFDIPDREFATSTAMPVLAADLVASLRRSESNISPGPFFVDRKVENIVPLATAVGSDTNESDWRPSFHNPPEGKSDGLPFSSSTFFSQPGLYRVLFGSQSEEEDADHRDVSVNLANRVVSQINQPRLEVTSEQARAALEVDTRRTIPWRSLVFLALVLGVLEWFTFNRKVTI